MTEQFYIVSKLNNLVLEVKGGLKQSGTPLVTGTKRTTNNLHQLWRKKGESIESVDSGLVIDISGINHQDLIAYWYHGKANQKFRIDGSHIVNPATGKVFDVSSSNKAPGTPVLCYALHGGLNQQWVIEPVSTGSAVPSGPIPFNILGHFDENRIRHFTTKFLSQDVLIVRRGFDFVLEISSTVNLSSSIFEVQLVAHPESENKYIFKVTDEPGNKSQYYANVKSRTPFSVILNIHIPADATPGQYFLSIKANNNQPQKFANQVIILFNPWCPDDTVYLEDELWRNEYVLNDQGLIWVGNAEQNSPVPWNFGQFNVKSLLCSLYILQQIPFKERHDPVLVARRTSALANVNDDNGILWGNWSGNYAGGTPPFGWTGSVAILEQFEKTKKPVKFAQCWVFSGTVTSIMRCLGIAARSVTTFNSAHDTSKPFNRKVDYYYKVDGTYDSDKTNDSVWNFHVWNDVWMKRPDLKGAYGGWQAIDATPQEESEGIYQTGPVPVVAVRNGEKDIPYDIEFVFAEVNADSCHHVAQPNGEYKLVRTVTDNIGSLIKTKAIGKNEGQDITLEYKHREGTVEERISQQGGQDDSAGDVYVSISPAIGVPTGQPIKVTLTLQKKGNQPGARTAKVNFSVSAIVYTGKNIGELLNTAVTINVPADGSVVTKEFVIELNTYIPFLKTDHSLIARAVVNVPEQNQSSLVFAHFDLEDPQIHISAPATINKLARILLTGSLNFKNPLTIPLTQVVLTIEGQGLVKKESWNFDRIEPGAEINQTFRLVPTESGKKYLVATLMSKEVFGTKGNVLVEVL